MTEIRLLTLHQPYASATALGLKQTETRHWPTDYRGWVAIHAAGRAVTKPMVATKLAIAKLIAGSTDCLLVNGSHRWLRHSPRGCVVALARIADCWEMTDGDRILSKTLSDRVLGEWKPGRFAWDLADVIPLQAVWQCQGAQKWGRITDPYMLQEFQNLIAIQQKGAA